MSNSEANPPSHPPSERRPPSAVSPSGAPLSPSLVNSINAALDAIPDKSIAAIIQVPVTEDGERVLKGQMFVNVGNGLSFTGWIEHELDVKKTLGWGVAVRKTF